MIETSNITKFEPSGLSETIFKERYAIHKEESWDNASRRLASHIAGAEKSESLVQTEEKFYEEIVTNRFMPAGRIWYGSGRPRGQLLNCFVLPTSDSREGWGKTIHDVIVVSGMGGGVGINVSPIRPRGSAILGTGGIATGSVSLMQMINAVGDVLVAGGGRRLALMLALDIDHPDIPEFLDKKLDRKELNNANVSVILNTPTDAFTKKVRNGEELPFVWGGTTHGKGKAKEIWEKIVNNAWQSGEPGVLNGHLANQESNIFYHKPLTSTNPCFAGNQKILTEQGYFTFLELFESGGHNNVLADNRIKYNDDGKEESIEKWAIKDGAPSASIYHASQVEKTRENTQIYKIETNLGYSLRVTPDHKIATPSGMKEAKDLVIGEELLLTLPEATGSVVGRAPEGTEENSAVLMGLIAGDGTFGVSKSKTTNVYADFWGSDIVRISELVHSSIDYLYSNCYEEGASSAHTPHNAWQTRKLSAVNAVIKSPEKIRLGSAWLANFLATRFDFTRKTKHSVPKAIMENARGDIARYYLAGLFYADGSIQGTIKTGVTIRLAQSNEELLKDIQLLLQANGIMSKISLRRPAGMKLLPDGKGGHKEYPTKAQWELIIGKDRMVFANVIGFLGHPEKEEKLFSMGENKSSNRSWRNPLTVTNIYEDGYEDVYCLQQKETRSIVVNGIAAARCGEIWLENYGCCDLGALVLPRFVDAFGGFDWDAFKDSIHVAVRFLDNVLTVNEYPLPEIRDNCLDVRRIGLGIMGLHSALIKMNYRYSSPSALAFVDTLMSFLKEEAYRASINLSIEKGSFAALKREEFVQSGFIKRAIPDDIKKGILEHGIRNCAVLTIAPTGTTGMVSNVSTGIEPLFSAAYWRRFYRPTSDGTRLLDKQLVIDPLWGELERQGKDISVLEGAYDVSPEGHFEMQRICQAHIDNAVSKTINLPQNYPVESLSDLWLEYLPELKGSTFYRAGSRGEEPLEAIPLAEARKLASHAHLDSSVIDQNSMDCVGDSCAVPEELKPKIEDAKYEISFV